MSAGRTSARIDARAVEDAADLHALASLYTQLDKSAAGPCPKCGGTDRFHLRKSGGRFTGWKCRKCSEDKYRGAIDLVMWAEDLPFRQAVARLTGDVPPPASIERRGIPAPKPTGPVHHPDTLAQLLKVAAYSADRLASDGDANAQAGRDLLAARGIDRATWEAWRIGYSDRYGGSLSLPFVLPVGMVGIRYRAIVDQPPAKPGGKPQRYFSHKGSEFVGAAFGLHRIEGALDAGLVVIEGEINAMSVYQALRARENPRRGDGPEALTNGFPTVLAGVPDVLSLGSESAGADSVRALAKRYARLLIWTDDHQKGDRLAAGIGHPNAAVVSSEGEERKQDANDVLREAGAAALAAIVRDRMPPSPPLPARVGGDERREPTPPKPAPEPEREEEWHVEFVDGPIPSPPMDTTPEAIPGAMAEDAAALLSLFDTSAWSAHPRAAQIRAAAEEIGAGMVEYRAVLGEGRGGEWRQTEGGRIAELGEVIAGRREFEPMIEGEDLAALIRDTFAEVGISQGLASYYEQTREIERQIHKEAHTEGVGSEDTPATAEQWLNRQQAQAMNGA